MRSLIVLLLFVVSASAWAGLQFRTNIALTDNGGNPNKVGDCYKEDNQQYRTSCEIRAGDCSGANANYYDSVWSTQSVFSVEQIGVWKNYPTSCTRAYPKEYKCSSDTTWKAAPPPADIKCPDCIAGENSSGYYTKAWLYSQKGEGATIKAGEPAKTYDDPAKQCSAGCLANVVMNCGTGKLSYDVQVFTTPEGGLYRVACTWAGKKTGESCNETAANGVNDKNAPPIPCPGTSGTVNGTAVCLQDSSSSSSSSSGSSSSGSSSSSGGSSSSSSGSSGGTSSGGGSSGGGSSSGGASSGGGSSSGGSSSGSGSSSSGGCSPGAKDCPMKIDENGTPNGEKAGEKANETTKQAFIDQEKNFQEKTKVNDLGFDFGIQLPQGSCSPRDIKVGKFSMSLDICKPLGMLRELWAYAIYVLSALYIWRSATSAVGSSGGK